MKHLTVLLLSAALLPMAAAEDESKPVSVGEDMVVLTNKHRISGYLLDQNEQEVTIRTVGGKLTIPRYLVLSSEISFSSRLNALDPQDYAGHLELARWCIARNQRDDALTTLSRVANHDAMDLEGLRLLARLTDESLELGPEEALPLYRRYRDAGGQHEQTLRRLDQLEAVDAENKAAMEAYEQLLSKRVIQEGIESTGRWVSEDPRWSNQVRARVIEAEESGGDKVLRLDVYGDKKDSYKKAAVRWRQNMNVHGSNILHLQAANPGKDPFKVSVAVKTGSGWDYFESPPLNVPADNRWHTLEFDLLADTFKCEKDGWAKYAHRIDNSTDVREFQVQVHNGKKTGHLFINHVGFRVSDTSSIER